MRYIIFTTEGVFGVKPFLLPDGIYTHSIASEALPLHHPVLPFFIFFLFLLYILYVEGMYEDKIEMLLLITVARKRERPLSRTSPVSESEAAYAILLKCLQRLT